MVLVMGRKAMSRAKPTPPKEVDLVAEALADWGLDPVETTDDKCYKAVCALNGRGLVPKATEVAQYLGLGVTTVRTALHRLASKGRVVRSGGLWVARKKKV